MSVSLAAKRFEQEEEDAAASLVESLYDENDEYEQQYDDMDLRPIVVGYAFGPKKLRTMGVVMAEASKTKLSASLSSSRSSAKKRWTRTVPPLFSLEDTIAYPLTTSEAPMKDRRQMLNPSLTRDSLSNHNSNEPRVKQQLSAALRSQPLLLDSNPTCLDTSETSKSLPDDAHVSPFTPYPLKTPLSRQQGPPEEHDKVVFTVDRGLMSTNASADGIGIRNIVRYFRSSCSSVADSMSTGTCTASSTAGSQRTASTARPTVSSGSSCTHRRQRYPARVSFVPLDMEIPLEEQHGGQMDVILHKLTEDILCLSQISMEHEQLKDLSKFDSTSQIEEALLRNPAVKVGETEVAALRRVHRLCQFQKTHPNCYLADDPVCVQKLMSRSDIARTLQTCLHNITSTSGIAVGSPKSTTVLQQPLELPELSFPIIAKPLIAAGTKASHAMAVVLDPDSFKQVAHPCLCQEYCNHDAVLYKVYVLGDHVSVHKRRSLPNLPRNTRTTGYLEFDSQRPYPRLSDFGFVMDDDLDKTPSKQKLPLSEAKVTAEEVKPIVDALKEAFGLDLFGFDVLITSTTAAEPEPRMLVVDVNYFPSYKEVPHFPALLARYLTDRAIESRRMTQPQH